MILKTWLFFLFSFFMYFVWIEFTRLIYTQVLKHKSHIIKKKKYETNNFQNMIVDFLQVFHCFF